MSQSYVMFRAANPMVRDGTLDYYNRFDIMVDAFYAAMEKLEVKDVNVGKLGGLIVITRQQRALQRSTTKKLKAHIDTGKGTPRKPNVHLQGFIRSLFDEKQSVDGELDVMGCLMMWTLGPFILCFDSLLINLFAHYNNLSFRCPF